ncbi:putative RNA-directed DNA polymerase [Senna tora]|uniref:Putative RNA-directed DNA polymerase n=1 Tax=Senna tora TaxID=362788 RepID=A0A834XCE3_9FABA|nr:putative RNA-directed DNA polymerase [Senna tora]
MGDIAINYFQELFTTCGPTDYESVTRYVPKKLTDELIETLDAPFTMDEVKEACFGMHPTKAPGTDGFPSLFYQKYWDTVGEDIARMALDFLNNGMLPGREVLKLGLIRRIGDGNSTGVFTDPWDGGGQWDIEKVNEVFEPLVAEAVIKIPLSRSNPKDSWMWRFNANGLFSVKSAYKVVHNSYSRTNTWTRYSSVWKKIWKGNLPPKIRSFCWRACRGILPTCINLKNRGVDVDTRCLCGLDDEDTCHALVACPVLKPLWDNYMPDVGGPINTNVAFVEWFSNNVQRWSCKQMEIYGILAYKVWNRRNKIRLNERAEEFNYIGEEAKKLWVTLNEAPPNMNDTTEGTRRDDRNRAIRDGKWEAPMWREMKVNVDASLLEQGKGGIGCVVRNFQGRCLAAFAKRMKNIESAELLEAFAFLEGLELAKNLRCDNIILEGDAKKVVDLIHGSSQNLSHLGMLVDDIRKGMKNFSRVKVQWVPRNSNAVADRIANFACTVLVL